MLIGCSVVPDGRNVLVARDPLTIRECSPSDPGFNETHKDNFVALSAISIAKVASRLGYKPIFLIDAGLHHFEHLLPESAHIEYVSDWNDTNMILEPLAQPSVETLVKPSVEHLVQPLVKSLVLHPVREKPFYIAMNYYIMQEITDANIIVANQFEDTRYLPDDARRAKYATTLLAISGVSMASALQKLGFKPIFKIDAECRQMMAYIISCFIYERDYVDGYTGWRKFYESIGQRYIGW